MKISFFEIKGWERAYLRRKLKGHELSFFSEPLTAANAEKAKKSEAISVFIYSKIDQAIISQVSDARLITTRSTGYDHIDLAACAKKKITVTNVPFYGENTVAEHTFALILSLSRNVHKSYVRTLQNNFSIEGLKGFDLKGKTLGVVGAGRIGLHVIRIAKSFGMNVLAYDVTRDNFLAEVLGFSYASLENVLSSSDIITLHVPYNEHTHHLINRDSIKKIKRGAILINTARGKVVDTAAVIEALDKKILSGAGLDVLEGEELIKEEKQLLYEGGKAEALGNLVKDHVLVNMDNVVFTPHIGFYSQEALERILETTVGNIESFLERKPQNVIS